MKPIRIANKKMEELDTVFGGADKVPAGAKSMYRKSQAGGEKNEGKEDRHEYSITRVLLTDEEKAATRARVLPPAKRVKTETSDKGFQPSLHPHH